MMSRCSFSKTCSCVIEPHARCHHREAPVEMNSWRVVGKLKLRVPSKENPDHGGYAWCASPPSHESTWLRYSAHTSTVFERFSVRLCVSRIRPRSATMTS